MKIVSDYPSDIYTFNFNVLVKEKSDQMAKLTLIMSCVAHMRSSFINVGIRLVGLSWRGFDGRGHF